MKKLGIVGGLGPAASCHFYERITRLTKADCDQQHLEIILYSIPKTPDRSDFITGKSSESPLPSLLKAVKALNSLNADYIAIPCVTAHYFIKPLQENSLAPIINIAAETAEHLQNHGIKSAAILATDGTVASGFWHYVLESKGIRPILTEPSEQSVIMDLIRRTKSGRVCEETFSVKHILDNFREKGAQSVLLACTELSTLFRDAKSDFFVDCIEILAYRSIVLCGGEVIKKDVIYS